jgi:hydrogenase expression/formation protein HypC
MCLAVPMKIASIGPDRLAVAELDGSRQDVDLSLLTSVQPGDYVIVHAGYAIEKLNEDEARKQLELFRELAAIWKT